MILKQFFDPDSSTYTYLLGNYRGADAIIIDPVEKNVPEYLEKLEQENLRLIYVLDTHMHDDHISGLNSLCEQTSCMILAYKTSKGGKVSKRLRDGDIINLTGIDLHIVHTPGHTQDSICIYFREGGFMFTGDTVWIRGNGRTDSPDSSAEELFDSIHQRVYVLPDDTIIYPGHDEKGENFSFIGRVRRQNEFLSGRSRDDFIKSMESLNKSTPDKAIIPENQSANESKNKPNHNDATLSCKGLTKHLEKGKAIVIDLRDYGEISQTGAISGSLNIPYLEIDKSILPGGRLSKILSSEREVVFVCAHGERSRLTLNKMEQKYASQCFHLSEGISHWKEDGYPLT